MGDLNNLTVFILYELGLHDNICLNFKKPVLYGLFFYKKTAILSYGLANYLFLRHNFVKSASSNFFTFLFLIRTSTYVILVLGCHAG